MRGQYESTIRILPSSTTVSPQRKLPSFSIHSSGSKSRPLHGTVAVVEAEVVGVDVTEVFAVDVAEVVTDVVLD